MSLTVEDVERLVRLCRGNGVGELRFEGLHLRFHESAFAATTRALHPPAPDESEEAPAAPPPPPGRVSSLPADDVLFDHLRGGGA